MKVSPIQWGVLGVVVFIGLTCGVAFAQEQPAAKPVKVAGVVKAVTDEEGKIVSAKIVSQGDKQHSILLDEKGIQLAKALNGKQVKVKATFSGGLLKVVSYKEIVPKAKGESEQTHKAKPEE